MSYQNNNQGKEFEEWSEPEEVRKKRIDVEQVIDRYRAKLTEIRETISELTLALKRREAEKIFLMGLIEELEDWQLEDN